MIRDDQSQRSPLTEKVYGPPPQGIAQRAVRTSRITSAMVHRLEGNNEQATQEFMQAAKRVPNSHLLLGLILKDSGDLDGAERELGEAERVNPRNGQVELELGKILLSRGQLSEAALRLEKAEQYMPTTAAVPYELARLYARLGQKEKSSQHLKKFKELPRPGTVSKLSLCNRLGEGFVSVWHFLVQPLPASAWRAPQLIRRKR